MDSGKRHSVSVSGRETRREGSPEQVRRPNRRRRAKRPRDGRRAGGNGRYRARARADAVAWLLMQQAEIGRSLPSSCLASLGRLPPSGLIACLPSFLYLTSGQIEPAVPGSPARTRHHTRRHTTRDCTTDGFQAQAGMGYVGEANTNVTDAATPDGQTE